MPRAVRELPSETELTVLSKHTLNLGFFCPNPPKMPIALELGHRPPQTRTVCPPDKPEGSALHPPG